MAKEEKEKKVVKDLFQRYLEEQKEKTKIVSREYKIFRTTTYAEKVKPYLDWSQKIYRIFPIPFKGKQADKLQKAIDRLYLPITPSQVFSFALFATIVSAIITTATFFIYPFLGIVFITLTFLVYWHLSTFPLRLIKLQKSQASTELILAILYLVIYMRNVSNLENAIKFAAENLEGPLSLDFKKILWDTEALKYSTVQEALDDYINQWGERNKSFVDSIHLIEASMHQRDEKRRTELLDGALNRILTGATEVMEHYVNDLRMPVTALFMFGVTLPVMGLVLFPIMGSFLGGTFTAPMLFIFYCMLIPFVVWYIGQTILEKRPIAFPQPDVSNHPDAPPKGHFKINKTNFPAWIPAAIIFIAFFIPYLVYFITIRGGATDPNEIDIYFSLLFILAIGLGIATYNKLISRPRMKVRKKIYDLESHFSDAIFQIGNRMAEGFPPETALIKTANSMKGTSIAGFIRRIVHNIYKLGHDLQTAIFDKVAGAVKYYPSKMIESAMRIFVSSAKESPEITSSSMVNMSVYLKRVHQIEEKIKDVLSEILSSVKFQSSFIAPLIAGIVVGLTSMIILVLSAVQSRIGAIQESLTAGAESGASGFFAMSLFQVSSTIPLDVFQIIVGIYLVEVIIITAILISKIEYGEDSLKAQEAIGNLLLTGLIIYFAVAFVTTLAFSGIARLAILVGGAI
jgi:hypothetical protein